jgi:L-malate glycosyltransferase
MTTGGAEVLANRIGRAFQGQHEVVFACLDGIGELGEGLIADGFVVEHLGRGKGIDRSCMKRLNEFLAKHQIDLVHAHQYTPFFYAAGARTWWNKLPIVFTEHGRFYPDSSSIKRTFFNRVMLRKYDHVIAVGEHVRQALIKYESFPPHRVAVIYNGINLEPYCLDKESIQASRIGLRNALGIDNSSIVVMQVARLDPIKDHLVSIRAIAKLQNVNAAIHLAIVGEGPERQRIETEIDKLGVARRVHMMGLRRNVPELLRAADIVLLTSLSEGIPLTLIEGMACELPCVSTDVGGVREIVDADKTAILRSAGDVDGIANAIAQLASDESLRQSMGASGRHIVDARFNEQTMLDEYRKLFSQFEPQALASVR